MGELIKKIDWKKVAKVASCVFTGVLACASALAEEKQTAKVAELEARLSNLESK